MLIAELITGQVKNDDNSYDKHAHIELKEMQKLVEHYLDLRGYKAKPATLKPVYTNDKITGFSLPLYAEKEQPKAPSCLL